MFKNPSQEFVYLRTYSRWLEEFSRRENWEETVDRYINFIVHERGDRIPPKVIKKMKQFISELKVMPSMRALWTAGNAAKIDNTCMYNCAFQAVDSIHSFSECLYILMCGTGYGFSVENKYINKLPVVPILSSRGAGTVVIEDSKKGWADSLKILIENLYKGQDIDFDYSKIRKKGERLMTMGGRASGPEPLITLHSYVREVFSSAQGRKLKDIECHDIMCQIAEIVVVGGVRRSSEISLSDLNSEDMRNAKTGTFPLRRFMSNNSAVYTKKPDAVEFLKEWAALANSGSGERGIFNLDAVKKTAPERRASELIAGTNPCGEIALRSMEFCNLSEVVIRSEDDLDDLMQKVECATWIGAIQSTFTKFPYLRKKWKQNCEQERLLGVSLTGQMDNPSLMTKDNLIALKKKAIKVAKIAAKHLDINLSVSITTGKPSGTVSQLVDCASGCHVRYSPYGIRRYRISSTDPLFSMLKDQKVPMSPEVGQREYENGKQIKGWSEDKVNTWVLEFPFKSPEGSMTRHDVNAIQQLEHYKTVQSHWCEHNQSCTIYVKENEWFEVGNWVYENFDYINGVSFLPYDGGNYELAPYEEIDKKTYVELLQKFPNIDYTDLARYESEDRTEGAKNYACVGDKCELK
jgi:ribonucleoside-diphosphate reductase alpha chain